MREQLWRLIAWVVAHRRVSQWLFRRALRTPYTDIMSPDGQDTYMRRWWLFNPYPGSDQAALRKHAWLPVSVRMHHIMRPDEDRHLHDHPWDARSILLTGWYSETREDGTRVRIAGDTYALKHGEFHRINDVDQVTGVMTIFITYRYRGTWGFKVAGKKVPWRTYLGLEARA